MKEQDQIKAIAELDGWTHQEYSWISPTGSRNADRVKRHTNNSPLELIPLEQIFPDYLSSRDAVVPVIEKQINHDFQPEFDRQLNDILNRDLDSEDYCKMTTIDFVCATPSQLSEALLRATKKWKD